MPTALRMMRVFSLLALMLTACFFASAQTETATLSGVIQDPHGRVVPDVEVTATRIETGTQTTTKTNGAGIYVFTNLMPGDYHLTVRRPGFKEIAIKQFELHVQDQLQQNFSLEIGSVSETVTVSGTNGMWAMTDSPAVGTLVTRDFVENMPLNGRSFQDLISLTPGAVSSSTSSNGSFSINGQRDDANYFMVDGVSANIYSGGTNLPGQGTAGTLPAQTAAGTTQALLSVDAMAEFRIQTSGYTAEYGRQPGGEVQLTSRSGTNDWHGTAFDYLRNTVFDANSWFANAQGIPRQAERQNDFGGTLGGPVRIPGLYNGKDRTFFFFSYEGLRLLLPNFSQEFVPTVAFRQTATASVQPFVNAWPIPNGPANTTDGCTVNTANGPSPCDGQFSAGYSNPSSLDATSVRVDHNWGAKLRLFGRYANTPSYSGTRIAPANEILSNTTNTRIVTVGATAALSSRIVNDIRFNYSLSDTVQADSLDSFGGATPFAESLINPAPFVKGGTFEADAFFCVTSGVSWCHGVDIAKRIIQQHQYNLVDGLSWTVGTHELKFGVDYRKLLPTYNFQSYEGALCFCSLSPVQTGSVDDFVLGGIPVYPRFWNLSLYAQDHWRLAPRLTLDYGLRWEFNPVPGEVNGITPVAVTEVTDLASMQLAPPGTAAYHTQYRNFAPRVGFAWSAMTSQRHPVVLRGGFGVYYDTGQAQWASAYGGFPFLGFYDAGNVTVPVSAAAAPPPTIPLGSALTPPYAGFTLMDPNLKLPYTEQYNLSADFGLSSRNTLSISFVGNQGHRLLDTRVYSSGAFPNPNFQFPTITYSDASSNYNGLQLQDRGYAAPGLQLIASYTWAHAIDNVSSDYSGFGLVTPVRGNSNNDIRQTVNLALNYEIPGMRNNGFGRALTRGWVFANRFVAQSGYPFEVVQGSYIGAKDQKISIYPDLAPGVPLYLHGAAADVNGQTVPGNWRLNAAAFVPVTLNPDGTPVRQGDLPRNFLKGPGLWTLNSALERTFQIHERLRLAFRAEAFNIFNHPSFTGIDNFLGDPTFGQAFAGQTIGNSNQLYATGAPRSWQFMLKLQF